MSQLIQRSSVDIYITNTTQQKLQIYYSHSFNCTLVKGKNPNSNLSINLYMYTHTKQQKFSFTNISGRQV